jgi:predicted Holliday junction resolvase-like endonuclease
MSLIGYIIIAVVILIAILSIIYFFLIGKLRKMNTKIFKYKEEVELKTNNVLIVYQPSRHKTTIKIKDLVKEELLKKGYGIKAHTLNKKNETYSEYKYVIFIAPVYFGEINKEFINKVRNNKINNLIIIYNGLNNESNNEDKLVSKEIKSKYHKTKLHTSDIELVKEFLNREGL